METMKRYIFIVLSCLILLALLGCTIYKYESRPKPRPGETLQQAVVAEAKAKQTMALHDAVNSAALKNANNQIDILNDQKTTLCSQIKAAKLPQPLCL